MNLRRCEGTASQQALMGLLFYFPKGREGHKDISVHLSTRKIKREWEGRTSSVCIRHLLLSKVVLPLFCSENGCSFHSCLQQPQALLLGFFSGLLCISPKVQFPHRSVPFQTGMLSEPPPCHGGSQGKCSSLQSPQPTECLPFPLLHIKKHRKERQQLGKTSLSRC